MATLSQAFAIARAHHRAQHLELAEEIYRRILAVEPEHADALHLLGLLHHQRGNGLSAVELIQHAISVDPGVPSYYNNLGEAHRALGSTAQAENAYLQAIRLDPRYAAAYNNLGNLCASEGQMDRALGSFQKALELEPDFAGAYNNIATVLLDCGDSVEAGACFRRAAELQPTAHFASNFLTALLFDSTCGPQTIFEACRRWNARYARPLARLIKPHTNDPDTERRLRVGYVLGDFPSYAVLRFLLPLVQSHDRSHFEVFSYGSVGRPDTLLERYRAAVDMWRDTANVKDEQLADVVRQDRIDLLVDLSLHMAGNRLITFALKPAPVQVTYLAYPGTSGLDTIDYRFTDPYIDALGSVGFYTERSVHLPETYWCYSAPEESGGVKPRARNESQRLIFGCLNSFCKITDATLALWREVLRAVPESRLLLSAPVGRARERALGAIAGDNVGRVEFTARVPGADYFRLYDQIDIALDPTPYGGGATTCDALWMGVPVVSLAGRTAVGRGGLSILSNIGLPDLVARDADQYVRIAVRLAADRPRVAELRATLRERMQKSPLMDARRFARNVEAAYREMWRQWCRQPLENVRGG